jgi:formylglycine-generating enzyme required for sulfatase activity
MKSTRFCGSGAVLSLLLCFNPASAEAQAVGAIFKDCAGCPEMIVMPGGSFLMGTLESAQSPARGSEGPQRQVTLKPFAIGKFEVTQAQWIEVMGDDPSANKGATLPVENVSWNAANSFVQKLSEKTGKPYRLPTEAEWEYAARAGSTTAYAFGNEEALLSEHGWFDSNSGMETHPVGEKPANNFGLHDTHGNVWEWVQDCFHESYVGAPVDGSAAPEYNACDRVSRGGSWYDIPEVVRSAYRYKDGPNNVVSGMGLRVVRTLP